MKPVRIRGQMKSSFGYEVKRTSCTCGLCGLAETGDGVAGLDSWLTGDSLAGPRKSRRPANRILARPARFVQGSKKCRRSEWLAADGARQVVASWPEAGCGGMSGVRARGASP